MAINVRSLAYVTLGSMLGAIVAVGVPLQVLSHEAEAASAVWRERGFDDFVDGRFSSAGQNLYVSRAA